LSGRPERFVDPEALAERIVAETGGDVRLGLPIGAGKANHVANALFRRARGDPSMRLRIFTALTPEQPRGHDDISRRFLDPLGERLFAGWEPLEYAQALRGEGLPPNVEVHEFFFQPGAWLGSGTAQQSHVSVNYTQAAEFLEWHGINVIAQLVVRPDDGETSGLSLSCNSDVTLDILDRLRWRGGPRIMVGQVNSGLPFMPGPAVLPEEAFDFVLEGEEVDFAPFAPPNPMVSDADHAIGLRAAALVEDGGTLQIGIGSIGDAFGAALLMRHQAPALFADTIRRLGWPETAPEPQTAPFRTGLYAASEMLAPCFLPLRRAGILKREAADGAILHSGFFVGSRAFYQELKDMPPEERALFRMSPISFVNALLGEEEVKRRDRRKARFVNNAMMATLLGAVVSDALEDNRIVSGVGGQYNFVAQGLELDGARVVMTLPATRETGGNTVSTIVWSYGHVTIPRHLRDIIVTEYGVADLRHQSDRDCIVRMLGLAASRFHDELVGKAQEAGKIEPGFSPPGGDSNRPERIAEALESARREGWCGPFPFGTDLTEEERLLAPALERLKAMERLPLVAEAASALGEGPPSDAEAAALKRLGLEPAEGAKERLARNLVLHALRLENPGPEPQRTGDR
jgi:hypothetical protein